ncbi:LysR substrate-binding domain-containing protein [Bordetella pertussis]|uniref:LysR substrate-binding domain-containing protein n=1 Tax=Bordetella pertussis TaxID=520 RepID=UPI00366D5D1C
MTGSPSVDAAEIVRRLTSRLKMRHLQLLLHVRQLGSLTRVAQQLSTSQPAVTNALAELEDMFGAPLFQRTARGMTPTPLGLVVLARAEAIIHDLRHLVDDMGASASGYTARLHLGVTPFVSSRLIAAAIGRAQRADHRLAASVHDGISGKLLAGLRDHSLDVVVARAGPAMDVEGIVFEPLYVQQPRLIASRRLAARLARRALDWSALAELDWILGVPQTAMRDQVASLFMQAGIRPPAATTECHSAKLIGELIAASDRALSIVPADIADELVSVAGVAIVPFSFTWHLPPIAVFMRHESQGSAPHRLFAEALREECRHARAG